MASPAISPGAAGIGGPPPQQGGGAQPTPAPTAQPTSAVAQLVAQIAGGLDMLQQIFPPSAPKVQEMQKSLLDIGSLMGATQSPQQSPAPPI